MGAAGVRISVVADLSDQVATAAAILAAVGDADVHVLAASLLTPFRRAYRDAALGIVSVPRAMPAAVLVQRLTHVPWLAYLDESVLETLEVAGDAMLAWAIREASIALVPTELMERAAPLLGGQRTVDAGDTRRVAEVVADVALADDARTPRHRSAAGLAAEVWMFANDRATRLAIRLVSLTRKAAVPIHPQHLIGAPWHHWYLDVFRATDRVLDIGCSNGVHTLVAAACTREVVGVDLDVAAVEQARRRAAELGLANAHFHVGDLSDAAFVAELATERFDVVLALDVLEHLSDRAGFLRALRPALADGGRLVLSVPSRDTPYKRWRRRVGAFAYSDPDHKMEFSDESLSAELGAAGFRIARSERGGYDTPFLGFNALLGAVSLRLYKRLSARRYRLSLCHPDRASALRVVAAAAHATSEE
jgi:SAM-dependent methyltransferase